MLKALEAVGGAALIGFVLLVWASRVAAPAPVTGAIQVKVVARLLLALGVFNLFVGFIAGGALGKDIPTDGSIKQVAFGPALLVSGLLAVFAWRRNVRLEGPAFGLAALVILGGTGLVFFNPINPYTVLMLVGVAVYLSPGGRAAFRGIGR